MFRTPSDVRRLQKQMASAETYADWYTAAEGLDVVDGSMRWRRVDFSRLFDHKEIRIKLDQLRALRMRGDLAGILFMLNEGIHGNVDGIGLPQLYQRARSGTKHLIEAYVAEVADAIELLASRDIEEISNEEKLDFFHRAEHCYGKTALMLSGSGMLAYFHAGVVTALLEQDLLPDIISGSSGGAIVGSLVSTRPKDELNDYLNPKFLAEAMGQDRAISSGARRSLKPRIIGIEDLIEMVETLIPDVTFQESLRLSGLNMNVSIAPAETHQKSRLLNSITSPNVLMRSAVIASTALPGFFPPATLVARDTLGDKKSYLASRRWVDGAISDDLPARRLSRLYGVNHYIVSQTNPHIIPFISDSKRSHTKTKTIQMAAIRTSREWLNAGAAVMHRPISRWPAMNKFVKTGLAILNQDYMGDVNILPPFRISNPLKLMSPLSMREIEALVAMGVKQTWPQIEMIRNQTRISRALASILKDMGGGSPYKRRDLGASSKA